jgi:SpoIID/LytB domain protein
MRTPRPLLPFLTVLLLASACTESTSRRTSESTAVPSSSPSPSPPSPTPSISSDFGDVVSIEAPAGGSFLVRGAYPRARSDCKHAEQPRLKARYPGRLTIRRAKDETLTLTVTLPFERYLEGIAEVPSSWPRAALEAQAIAARSYALASTGWDGAEGETLEDPICSTTSCQVYAGMPVGRIGTTGRWYRAVRATRGQVLLYQGRPATTFYFSTSNGRTYDNEDVFGGAPLPYLRGVPEHDDRASPTSHWTSRVPLGDLRRFLAHQELWPAGRRITDVTGDGARVTVRGGGTSIGLEGSTFRAAVNAAAPCLEPRTYPPGALPVTIPSRWMTISSANGVAVARGRGWGHGIGMVQWGAYGKARRGLSAGQILAAYYGGLHPQRFPEPGLIHVQIATGLTALRLDPSRPGATLEGRSLGGGPIVVTGGDALAVEI